MVYQLIYTAALTERATRQDLLDIAQKSAVKNAEHGITGILLTKEGSVLQVLEGDQTKVETLYARIKNDPRIGNLIVLIRREGEKREFPQWSMGFRHADDSQISGVFNLSQNSLPVALPQDASDEVQTFTQTFARVNGL